MDTKRRTCEGGDTKATLQENPPYLRTDQYSRQEQWTDMAIQYRTAALSLAIIGIAAIANAQFLGTAKSFAVLAGSTVTNTGPTVLTGDLGVWPGTAITGFPPGLVLNGATYLGTAEAMQAQSDLTSAYISLAGEAFDVDLSGQDLGGMTLFAGVYHFDSSAFLTGTVTLDAQGDPDAQFVFQMGSTLITATDSTVNVINSGDDCNVYWQVGSSATLGTRTAFAGHVLALTSITLNTGATIVEGSALARNGAVTLDSNTITSCAPVPEPMTLAVLGFGLSALAVRRRRRR